MHFFDRVKMSLEGVGIAFDSMRANKVRAGLTILGVAVGVFVVVVISAAIHGINQSVAEQFEAAGLLGLILGAAVVGAGLPWYAGLWVWGALPVGIYLCASLVALLPVISLLVVGSGLLGAVALRDFAVALFVGLFVGAYSSIFVAAGIIFGHLGI